MPRLPRILPAETNFPIYYEPERVISPARGFGRALEEFGQVFQNLQDGADRAEATKLVADTKAKMDGALQEAQDTIVDPAEFSQTATQSLEAVQKDALKTASNPRVARMVEGALSNDVIQANTKIKHAAFGKTKDKALSDMGEALDSLGNQAVANPEDETRIYSEAGKLIGYMTGKGFLNYEQSKKAIDQFNVKIADSKMRADPEGFMADVDAGRYNHLAIDDRIKLGEQARAKALQNEARNDKVNKQVKDIVEWDWMARANQGTLPDDMLQDALAGNNPHISPERARHFAEINANPPTGAGAEQVQAIASEYYLSPRTLPHINATRAKLRALQAQLGKPNPLISKLANELQNDQTAMENQAISRDANAIAAQNRGISNIQTEYDATKENLPPFIKNLIGNMDTVNKAKIATEYRKNGAEAARKLAESLAKGQKAKVDAIPPVNKKVLDLTR